MKSSIFTLPEVFTFILILGFDYTISASIGNEIETNITKEDIRAAFAKHEIGPEMIIRTPGELINITYTYGNENDNETRETEVNLGNELRVFQIQTQPIVSWRADPNKLYVMTMFDPDTPSRNLQWLGSFNHWLIGNIPGDDIQKGEQLIPYFGPVPIRTSGLHRYIFLVFEQDNRKKFESPGRLWFSVRNFVERYELSKPVAGNFFLAERGGIVSAIAQVLKGVPKSDN